MAGGTIMKQHTMASLAGEYLRYRRELGFKLASEGGTLMRFATFADTVAAGQPIDTVLALRWARLPTNASPLYWARRLEIVRCFARYVAVFDCRTQIPPKGILGPAHRRIVPHIYSEHEIAKLIETCSVLEPVHGLRPRTYATLFGLLACTGLRVSEALRLNDVDTDLGCGVLTIRETKFHKSRLVPMHPSVRTSLAAYRNVRHQHCPMPLCARFFLSDRGTALPYSTVRHAFRTIIRRLDWKSVGGRRYPRMYDLRHTFASRRLADWQREGIDVVAMLPALSTYMGHVKVSDTYWYLTAIPDLFAVAAETFETYANTKWGAPS